MDTERFNRINAKINSIEDTKAKLQAEISKVCEGITQLREELIDSCDHPEGSVFSVRYYWSWTPCPWILCIKCGLIEEGWGCGHDVFAKHDRWDLPDVKRQWAEKYVKVERGQDEQYCRRHPEQHYKTDLEGNALHPKKWIRIPEPWHHNWEERKHLRRGEL